MKRELAAQLHRQALATIPLFYWLMTAKIPPKVRILDSSGTERVLPLPIRLTQETAPNTRTIAFLAASPKRSSDFSKECFAV
ncbi:Uncharacterized protein HZ326_3490 [Fusarium oxysporum f. sp. albedinis]|nr:Uncharacterized protein HZ326_3490 [Fusarium oxysporum f. sp. albedinis]